MDLWFLRLPSSHSYYPGARAEVRGRTGVTGRRAFWVGTGIFAWEHFLVQVLGYHLEPGGLDTHPFPVG